MQQMESKYRKNTQLLTQALYPYGHLNQKI